MMFSDVEVFYIAFGAALAVGLLVSKVLQRLKITVDYPILIALGAAVFCLVLTYHTLKKREALFGLTTGAVTAAQKVTRKYWTKYDSDNNKKEVYYLCYQTGKELCVDVSRAFWNDTKPGDSIDITGLAVETEGYHATGTYMNKETYQWDWVALYLEYCAVIAFSIKLFFPNLYFRDLFGEFKLLSISDKNKP